MTSSRLEPARMGCHRPGRRPTAGSLRTRRGGGLRRPLWLGDLRRYFNPKLNSMVVVSFSVIRYTYVLLFVRFFVLMLKIHCLSVGSNRKAVSGVVETTVSFTLVSVVPLIVFTNAKLVTRADVPIELPALSQTRNFAGTVLPCLKMLDPSALIG